MINPVLSKISRFRPRRTVKLDKENKARIYRIICELSQPTLSFYLLVVLSTVIASFGLLVSSTAVVIGAMLVAPLMGPIFGIALGVSNGDRRLIKTSTFSELIGIIIAVTIALLIGLIPIRLGLSSEILARTQPTIYDIIIALFSGFAGAYALVDDKIGSTLPGVAIATALVPPLATCGICLALQEWSLAGGAFLLFFVNLLAIELAAATVYWLYRLVEMPNPNRDIASLRAFFRRFWLSIAILIFVAVFMTRSLQQIAANRALSEALKKNITEQVSANLGARVSDVRYQYSENKLQVMAEVLTPQEIDAQQVARIEKNLQEQVDQSIHLIVRSMISRDSDSSGYVFITEDEKARRFEQNEQNLFLANTASLLKQGLISCQGSSLADIQNVVDHGIYNVNAVIRTPSTITPEQVAELETLLADNLNLPIHLTVRSIITRDANSTRYLYDEEKTGEKMSEEELLFHSALDQVLREELKNVEPAANLLEFNYGNQDGVLLVATKIRTPVVFGPALVQRVEEALQARIDPQAKLIIRSEIGGDATSDWFLAEYDEALLETVSQP